MQRWLPAQGSGRGVLHALPIIAAALICAQTATSFEGSLTILSDEPTSTLDGHVPPHDLELQRTIIEIVDSGILTGSKARKFRAPQSAQPAKTQTTDTKTTKPSPQASAKTATQSTSAKTPPQAGGASAETSPFRKWVKPQSTTATDSAADDDAPQVARRLRKSVGRKPTTPRLPAAPKSNTKSYSKNNSKSSTAVASDLSIRADDDQSVQAPVTKSHSTEQAPVPPPSSYPAPTTEQAPAASTSQSLPPLTKSQRNLRKKIRSVLTHYYNRPLNTRDRSPWELMHAMLAYEAHSKVLQGGPQGDPITAVGWLCFNQTCKRRTLMYVNDDGDLRVRVGPALQGHRGQLLAMLAQSRINESYPMLVEGHELKIADLIEMEKLTCYPRTELTFKLIGLMHYLDSDEKWLNDQGMEWDIPRLISEELRQPVRGAACGGTHRLSGLTLAYKTRQKRGEPVDGQYLKAKKFVTRYQQYAYRLQNRDGSFSTEWFRGPGDEESLDRRLKTTGHILEWLLYAANEKELKHWRTTKAANYLANIMYGNRYKDWEAGPLGHAIHALLVYDRLVFSPYDPPEKSPIATKSAPVSRRR